MKLYIAVLDEFPDYMTPTLVAHAVLAAHLKFQDDTVYQRWLVETHKKCVVRVNQKEFDKIGINLTISEEGGKSDVYSFGRVIEKIKEFNPKLSFILK